MSEPDRSRWEIAADFTRIDPADRRNERRDYRDRNENREDCQSHMSTSAAAPVEIVVHRQHLPTRETTQLRGAGSVRASRGHKDRPQAVHVLPGFQDGALQPQTYTRCHRQP